MMSGTTVFVTGGTGFLGSHLLGALRRRGFSIIALDRSASTRQPQRSEESDGVETITADLLEPERYAAALRKADIVLHLAALTGRATQAEHFRVNAQGTEALLEHCRLAGVQRFLFVSSIATKFPDKSRYYYALAKARSELAVRTSGMRFTIIRPTIILGQGSPILAALERLVRLPVIPVFGNGRALVQPIYVDDVVEYILAVLERDRFEGETLEIGGPVILTIEELLQNIRQVRAHAHAGRGRFLHIPFGLLLPPLQVAESLGLAGLLPVNVGQLSSFRFDGTIEGNPLYESRRSTLRGVQEMLALSLAGC